MARQSRAAPCLILFLSVVSLTGCDPDLKTVCNDKVPAFLSQVSEAYQSFASRYPAKSYRTVASDDRSVKWEHTLIRDEGERQEWMSWSRSRIKELQKYMDAVEKYPKHRPLGAEMSAASNELILLYGYAEQGDALRLSGSLQRIQALGLSIQDKCHL